MGPTLLLSSLAPIPPISSLLPHPAIQPCPIARSPPPSAKWCPRHHALPKPPSPVRARLTPSLARGDGIVATINQLAHIPIADATTVASAVNTGPFANYQTSQLGLVPPHRAHPPLLRLAARHLYLHLPGRYRPAPTLMPPREAEAARKVPQDLFFFVLSPGIPNMPAPSTTTPSPTKPSLRPPSTSSTLWPKLPHGAPGDLKPTESPSPLPSASDPAYLLFSMKHQPFLLRTSATCTRAT